MKPVLLLLAVIAVAARVPDPRDISGVSQPVQPMRGLTAISGIKVGHHTLSARPTGCTVVLAENGAVAGVDVRGGAPGSRETALLDPMAAAQRIHAVVLAGGSAFGLDAATGTVRYLEERGIGVRFGGHTIPLVPSAILFDLPVGDGRIRPIADCGYAAAKGATSDPVVEGNVGAGAGATVGKMEGRDRAMKAGIGSAEVQLRDGVIVAALVAVNAVGDIIDPATGKVVAGTRTKDGKALVDVRTLLQSRPALRQPPGGDDFPMQNTTLGIVATNAILTKTQATRVAQLAHDGFARAIVPVHTASDGDIIFALATGTLPGVVDADLVGWAAAEAIAQAIVRAARAATSIPNYPAARDLK